MTQDEGKRICPHCGAENPESLIVTTCQSCLRPLAEAEEPAEKATAPTQPRHAVPEPTPPPVPAAVEPAPSATGEYWWPAPRMAALGVALGSVLGLVVRGPVLGGPLLGMTLRHRFEAIGSPVLFFGLFFGGAALLGFLIHTLIFRFVVLARCPKCSGPAVYRVGSPATYHCKPCGHVHRMPVSEGHGDIDPW